ncbi:MAG: hypothetical protein U0R71_09090 [Solirubrobacterales bacterium]
MRNVWRKGILALGVAQAILLLAGVSSTPAAFEPDRFAIESASASLSTPQAGAHADVTVSFEFALSEGEPYGLARDIEVSLPPGVIGNPQGIPRCSVLQLGNTVDESACPLDSQVGVTLIRLGGINSGTFVEPLYNMPAPGGDVVARLGFFAGPYPAVLSVRVDPIRYGLVATIEGAPSGATLIGASTTLWGVPADPSHDAQRLTPQEALNGKAPPGGRKATLPPAPFMSNPTSCVTPRSLTVTATTYELPAAPVSRTAPFPAIVGCGKLSFEPEFALTATNPEASAPTGVDVDLRIPQDETPQGRATSALRSAEVTLPPGLTINPAAGDGLVGCSSAEVGFETARPPACPDAAKLGSAELEVPALERVLHGSIYQRTPEPGHLFRFWLVTDELGVRLKLPAEIEADPVTGQLRTIFDGIASLGGNPQVPVSDIRLHFSGGPRAPLATPPGCGTFQTHYVFTPWSGNGPTRGDAPLTIGAGCGKGGFSPRLLAGTEDPFAGRFSPFTLELTRADGEANPSGLEVTLPPGLLGKLAGIPVCPDSAAPTGACPPASQVGTVATASGVGTSPLWIPQPGKEPTAVYLAGPYRAAPYSLVIRVPAQAGPFDLGTVVVRAGIYISPETAQITVKSDPLPQILQGVPIAYRAIHVDVSRRDFTLNPTDCSAKRIEATVVATSGDVATPTAGFQATNCAKLGFRPSLKLSLRGGTRRTQHPALKSVLTFPKKGEFANVAKASVTLPHSVILDPNHVGRPCTRPRFAAEDCPKISILGRAKAWTPLLDRPLEGNVYFRSNGGVRELPDIVADLRGQIRFELVGAVDSASSKTNARIRTTFFAVPDAPVTRFQLELKGGSQGLLVNSTNLCARPLTAAINLQAQNGRLLRSQPKIASSCGRKRR